MTDVLGGSGFAPPFWLRNPHVQTIAAAKLRRVPGPAYMRQRIETSDGDFLDLDWVYAAVGKTRSSQLVIISHGLEGNSRRTYVRGMANAFLRGGWDVCAWNFRGCSGEPNRLFRSYHSGATKDLETVVNHVLTTAQYDVLALIGFSLGGNLTLKYLGERRLDVHASIKGAVAVSAPCDLAASSAQLDRKSNAIYMQYFFRSLRKKAKRKAEKFPDLIDPEVVADMKTFREFDDYYTAPAHGFKDAEDYWEKASSKPFLPSIRVPTLIVSALDDPFLAPECFPYAEASASDHLHLLTPQRGGHTGFLSGLMAAESWSEQVARDFVDYAADYGSTA